MNEYTFFKDSLGTIWYRDCFTVKADSYEEAEKKAIEMAKNDEINNVDYSEPVWETWTDILPKDNDGRSTVEVLSSDDVTQTIWKNGK
jgi:hypothetical protein